MAPMAFVEAILEQFIELPNVEGYFNATIIS